MSNTMHHAQLGLRNLRLRNMGKVRNVNSTTSTLQRQYGPTLTGITRQLRFATCGRGCRA
jgi:hypothetical protein